MKRQSISIRLYARLLRFYPSRFRERFRAEMEQDFEDQYNHARGDGWWRAGLLWIRTGRDLVSSVIREHVEEAKGNMSGDAILLFCNRHLTFGRLWVALTICFMTICVAGTVYLLPKVYASKARILMRTEQGTHDPYRVDALLENIQSRKVLEPVIDELNLTAMLVGERNVSGEAKDAAYLTLRRMILISSSRNTGLLEIRVYGENPQLAAKIANKITEVARRVEGVQLSLLETATPVARPVRPNVPLNIVIGSMVSLLIAVVLAGVARLVLWRLARSARPVFPTG